MKIGDRAKVLKRYVGSEFIRHGDKGTIMNDYFANNGKYNDVFEVKFDKQIVSELLNADGTLDMCRFQLEVIEDIPHEN